jgi:protein-S-isoprenylcysteine O-methyltransferase Ste14
MITSAMDQAVVVIQVADYLRTYTAMVTAVALAFTTVNALTQPAEQRRRIAVFVFGINLVLVALFFAQLANLGRSITWRTFALAVGVTLIAISSWLEIRSRRKHGHGRSGDGGGST